MRPRRSQIPAFRAITEPLRNARSIADSMVGAFATREAAAFRKRIREQDFESFVRVPLAPMTIQRKAMLDLDLRTMIQTGHYLRSIKVQRWVPQPGLVRYRVGFKDTDLARDVDGHPIALSLNQLAALQEHGSAARNLPARPHWQPHLQDMTGRATVVAAAIQNAVLRS